MSEADTCRKYITPRLHEAGWQDTDQIREQVTFTHGRIVPAGKHDTRKVQKRVDYLLYFRRDFPLAVVEAKEDTHHAADGLPQAKEYAQTLGLRFAYASNGQDILEFDSHTGELRELTAFPSPEELWRRLNPVPAAEAEHLLTPGRTSK